MQDPLCTGKRPDVRPAVASPAVRYGHNFRTHLREPSYLRSSEGQSERARRKQRRIKRALQP